MHGYNNSYDARGGLEQDAYCACAAINFLFFIIMADADFEFEFDSWAKSFKLNKRTRDKLRRMALVTKQGLAGLSDQDMNALKLTSAQLIALQEGVTALQLDTAPDSDAPDNQHLKTLLSTANTAFDPMQNNVIASPCAPPTFEALDPRAILVVKARSVKAVHITEFLTDDAKRRRSPRSSFRIQSAGSDGTCTILQDEDTSYGGITIDQWGGANCRLMNFLLASGRLQRCDIEFYLAYTTKIFDFASKYTWASVLNYDQRYREVQAEYNMQWGTFAPQLELQLLQPKAAAPPTPSRPVAPSQEECKLFKTHKTCPYGSDCKYRHVLRADKALSDDVSTTVPRPKN